MDLMGVRKVNMQLTNGSGCLVHNDFPILTLVFLKIGSPDQRHQNRLETG